MFTKNCWVNCEQGTSGRKVKGKVFQAKGTAHALEMGELGAFGVLDCYIKKVTYLSPLCKVCKASCYQLVYGRAFQPFLHHGAPKKNNPVWLSGFLHNFCSF